MAKEKKSVWTTVRFTEQFHTALRVELARRRKTLQAAVEEALNLWMGAEGTAVSSQGGGPVAGGDLSAEERRYVARLLAHLRSNSPFCKAIKSLLSSEPGSRS